MVVSSLGLTTSEPRTTTCLCFLRVRRPFSYAPSNSCFALFQQALPSFGANTTEQVSHSSQYQKKKHIIFFCISISIAVFSIRYGLDYILILSPQPILLACLTFDIRKLFVPLVAYCPLLIPVVGCHAKPATIRDYVLLFSCQSGFSLTPFYYFLDVFPSAEKGIELIFHSPCSSFPFTLSHSWVVSLTQRFELH